MIEFEYDIKKQYELKKRFDPKLVSKALGQAAKRSGDKIATQVSKSVRQTYAIPASEVRGTLKVKRYRKYGGEQAYIWTGGRLELSKFRPGTKWVNVEPRRKVKSGPRKGRAVRRRGATVRIRKDKGRQLVPSGWYAKGHILRRRDPEDNASQPIKAYGPSIPGMVAYPELIAEVNAFLKEDLPKQFDNRMRELLYRQSQQEGS